MVYNGLWFTPLRESLDAFFEKVSETTTGEVKLQLYKGNIQPLARTSPFSLYSLDIASFTMGASYDQKDALGFINLVGLPIKVRAALQSRDGVPPGPGAVAPARCGPRMADADRGRAVHQGRGQEPRVLIG
jgi:hypothetical protein